ncbi:D-cysteine desulfhydrase [Actinomycetospora succinea]|uniref:D-cysteine desulfhydrase n=1 Tax=Actinomycetospora succinea TaxID=663603 RepID=A0A4R6VNJ9_9PSEU|nr:pyridoxal-phosphate dependent enzyme [Actinomycetospora succinea]TDQ60955.1 D-cysteine desulfhydrase [Actinomycetospora succinea]
MLTLGTRVPLATWPTPVEPAPRLARALGLQPDDLLVKRDDLTGLGGGGNKVRKLEWTVGAALDRGAHTLVTAGAPQSNHARLTAAAAARTGLAAVLVFPGYPDDAPAAGNLVLDALLGARIVWAGDVDHDGLIATAATVAAAPGHALVPFGGSSPTGALGYREAGFELRDQISDLDTVVVALGSGGTMAGLVSALGPASVLGVDSGAVDDPHDVVAGLLDELPAPAGGGELRIRRDQVGDGYATQTDAVARAMLLAARTEGLVLDPVYTGRALAGLVAALADGTIRPGRRTVLLHSGGLPGLFGHPRALVRAAASGPGCPAPTL